MRLTEPSCGALRPSCAHPHLRAQRQKFPEVLRDHAASREPGRWVCPGGTFYPSPLWPLLAPGRTLGQPQLPPPSTSGSRSSLLKGAGITGLMPGRLVEKGSERLIPKKFVSASVSPLCETMGVGNTQFLGSENRPFVTGRWSGENLKEKPGSERHCLAPARAPPLHTPRPCTCPLHEPHPY